MPQPSLALGLHARAARDKVCQMLRQTGLSTYGRQRMFDRSCEVSPVPKHMSWFRQDVVFG